MGASNQTLRVGLFNILCNQFNLEELRTLCWLAGVDYDSLLGEGKAAKARELIAHAEHRGQLSQLVESGRGVRPEIDWPVVGVSPESSLRSDVRLTFEPEMVRIPAGEFVMGSDPGRDLYAGDSEQPQHIVCLPEYSIARMPVTNAQYLPFVVATGQDVPKRWMDGRPPMGKEVHPAVNVSWYDAIAYCRWLTEATGKPYGLPSEAEWEKGARGTDGRVYPWGNQWDEARCNSSEKGQRDTTPVGAYPDGASLYGLLDMAGNVWEWTRSLWGRDLHAPEFKYPYDARDGRENSEAGRDLLRVVRGGSFDRSRLGARCAVRGWYFPDSRMALPRFSGVRRGTVGIDCVWKTLWEDAASPQVRPA